MLLVDGYNLLFAVRKPDRRSLDRDREALIADLERYCSLANRTMRIVFDHRGPRREKRPRIEVIYVEESLSADDRIVAMLEGTADRTAYRVVSSDRAIRKAAEARRFETVEAQVFWREVTEVLDPPDAAKGEPGQKEKGISPAEAEYWLKEFGFGGGSDETRRDR